MIELSWQITKKLPMKILPTTFKEITILTFFDPNLYNTREHILADSTRKRAFHISNLIHKEIVIINIINRTVKVGGKHFIAGFLGFYRSRSICTCIDTDFTCIQYKNN